MKFYLSSYQIGDQSKKLQSFFSGNKNIGYIPNALDAWTSDPQKKVEHMNADLSSLKDIELQPEILDLKLYFGKPDSLRKKIAELAGIWISGGNVFVLRQAMKLSGFDELLLQENKKKSNFVYGGYSAAGCVLSPTLRCYQIVDDPKDLPYFEQQETIWDGLGIIQEAFLPHFESDHSESKGVDKEVELCEKMGIQYKTLRDGEVWIF